MTTMFSLPPTPSEGPRTGQSAWAPSLPAIGDDQSFVDVVSSLTGYVRPRVVLLPLLIVFRYFNEVIDVSHTFEQLKTTSTGHVLRPLISSLSDRCHRPTIVAALLYVPSFYFIGIVTLI